MMGAQVVGAVKAVLPAIGRLVLGMRDSRFVLMVGTSVALAEWSTALQRRERRLRPQQIQQ